MSRPVWNRHSCHQMHAAAAELRARWADSSYVAFHAPRYVYLLDTVRRHRPQPLLRILDIGKSNLTTLLHETFGVPVDTMGFQADGSHETGRHHHFDLNDSARADRVPAGNR